MIVCASEVPWADWDICLSLWQGLATSGKGDTLVCGAFGSAGVLGIYFNLYS